MSKLIDQQGVIHIFPLLLIISAVGVISFLLISATVPLNGLFGTTNPKPNSKAATSPCVFKSAPGAVPAFCDDFSQSFPGGRGGDLDERKWNVSRVANTGNFWYSPNPICDQNVGAVAPDTDVRVCPAEPGEGPYFDEQFDDKENSEVYDFMPRQPFDFTNRMGTITFESDAKTAGSHTWWLELFVTDEPIPAASSQSAPGIDTNPRNGIGIQFAGCFEQGPKVGVSQFMKLTNFQFERVGPNWVGNSCFSAADGEKNHIEVRLSQQRIEVWMSDDDGANFRLMASKDNLNLPFSRGYVHFEHVQYNAGKESVPSYQHYEWANMGFDGPVLPLPRAYDVPDSLIQKSNDKGQYVEVGYRYAGQAAAPTFTLNNVDLSNATSAAVNLSVDWTGTRTLSYQFNNGTIRTFPDPVRADALSLQSIHMPVALSDLKSGTNTLKIWAPNSFSISNIDLTLETNSTTTPAPSSTPNCSKKSLGDINCNGAIDVQDYALLLTNFGQSGSNLSGDLNSSGKVDVQDYGIILSNFGK